MSVIVFKKFLFQTCQGITSYISEAQAAFLPKKPGADAMEIL